MKKGTKKSQKPAASPSQANGLSSVVKQNIRTIVNLRLNAARRRTLEERLADGITSFSGRMVFVYFHIGWFALWIAVNLGWLGIAPFDPFPFGLLTMIVSLEAIFLSAFVLISQNRAAREAEERADLDLQVNLLTEHEITRILQILDALREKLDVQLPDLDDIQDLEQETRPQDVLKEIEKYQNRYLDRRKPREKGKPVK